MIISLRDRARARFVPDAELSTAPRFSLSGLTVQVGPYGSAEEHERRWLRSIGCGNWYPSQFDETLFDAESRRLTNLAWHVPEQRFTAGDPLTAWRDSPTHVGGLDLVDPDRFELPPAGFLWYPADGTLLACLDEAPGTAEHLRLRIAPDLDLLVAGGRLYGWWLRHPADHLTSAWRSESETPTPPSVRDPDLPGHLAAYLDIVVEAAPEYPDFDEHSRWPAALHALIDAIDVTQGSTPERMVIRDAAVDLADFIS